MRKPMAALLVAVAVIAAACASRGGRVATEFEPGEAPAMLGDSLVALEMINRNFEEALVVVDLPDGRTVRLGWVPGNQTRGWLVPLDINGDIGFEIQLQAVEHEVGLGGQSRDVVRCRSRMHFAPGNYRTLVIAQPTGTSGSFCPGSRSQRR